MSSVVQFPDLNLYPGPTATSTATTTTTTTATPALLIPKPEPLDQPPPQTHFQTPVIPPPPTPPGFNFTSNLTTISDVYFQTPSFPPPPTPPGFSSTLNPTSTGAGGSGGDISDIPSTSTSIPGDANVYAEYNRITEMFHDAFANRMQSYGGSGSGNTIVDHNGNSHADLAEDCEDDYIENSQAIVLYDENNVNNENQLSYNNNGYDEAHLSNTVVQKRKYPKYPPRSGELVRVTDLGPDDELYFRNVIRRTRMIYGALRLQLLAEDDMSNERRVRGDLKASAIMRDRGLWLNRDKRIVGPIPGIFVGDIFFWRMELCIVGLHGQVQAGIDYLSASQSSNGEPIATSLIVSGGYEDDEDEGDVIIYTGQGGQDKYGRQCLHQKLEGGNLALERSMYYGIEVRVIRGFKYDGSPSGKVYVYDGLYMIVQCWFDIGKSGFGVYKYRIVRQANQAEMGSLILKHAQNLRKTALTVTQNGYVSLDISLKKENFPVLLFNNIDNERDPVYFEYTTSSVIPHFVYGSVGNGSGCDCVGGCGDNCFCVMKNGREFPYDCNGLLLRGKPLIFECGPHCRCPPNCRTRVTQKGLKYRFEVFRSRETNWGVRSWDLIQAGSFICEFAGVFLTRDQIQIVNMNGDNLVYPSRFSDKWAEWGDLSQIFDDYVRPSYPCTPPLDFALDVSVKRNVACYISHSTTPNAMVQLVLHDHNNVSFPRLMIFALENISPFTEISIDYGVADEYSGKLAICN